MAQRSMHGHAGGPANPFIITLRLDDRTHQSLTKMRELHFPKHRNYLEAHLTYFHALPADHLGMYKEDLGSLASRTTAFDVTVGPPFRMGGGVGISIQSPPSAHPSAPSQPQIEALHARLLKRWSQRIEMTNQDLMPLRRPHVTIQNKVEADQAAETFERVSRSWKDRQGRAVGLGLFEYLPNGRWKHVEDFAFTEEAATG